MGEGGNQAVVVHDAPQYGGSALVAGSNPFYRVCARAKEVELRIGHRLERPFLSGWTPHLTPISA